MYSMSSNAKCYGMYLSNDELKENPISNHFMNTQIMERFIKNKKKCPQKLIDETKKSKNLLGKKVKNIQSVMKKMKELNTHSEELNERIDVIYNEYRQEAKYYGENQEPKKSPIIISRNGKKKGEDIDKNLRAFISQKQEAKCFTFHRQLERLNWLETEDTHEEFGRFKKKIKNGELCCNEYNNKELIMNDTSKWYSLVIQGTNGDAIGLDIAGMKIFDFMVDGVGYYFQNKKNRDAIFKWINKK